MVITFLYMMFDPNIKILIPKKKKKEIGEAEKQFEKKTRCIIKT